MCVAAWFRYSALSGVHAGLQRLLCYCRYPRHFGRVGRQGRHAGCHVVARRLRFASCVARAQGGRGALGENMTLVGRVSQMSLVRLGAILK